MISDHLLTGRENARTARYLARLLHCHQRDITAGIERERRAGQPIIASCDPLQPGYYLAENAEELLLYCRKLNHRAGEIGITSRALSEAAEGLPAAEA